MCVVLNKTFLLSLIWNTWPLTSNLKYVNYWLQQWKKINPSCSMPPALIKATYDYFSISLQTDCLISLSEAIQHSATCAPLFSLVTLLAYALNTIWKCPHWRHMHSLECCLYCEICPTLNHDLTENYLFTNSERFHLRRVCKADRDTHSSGKLTRPIWGLHNLLRPFPANFWTLGLNLLRYSIWHVKAILYCKSSCIDSWLSLM